VTGLFITLEGGDGSGKSTQSRLLADWLAGQGRTVLGTREPGGTPVGVLIRDIVLHHRGEVAPRAEALLYAADRAQHITTTVRPALARGEVVIQDRYLDSSVAYQGAGRVLGGAEIRDLSLWAAEGLLPDLTILLDLDETAAEQAVRPSRGGGGGLPPPGASRVQGPRRRRTRPFSRRGCRRADRRDRRGHPGQGRHPPPLIPGARRPHARSTWAAGECHRRRVLWSDERVG
jgi:dTMP kinase